MPRLTTTVSNIPIPGLDELIYSLAMDLTKEQKKEIPQAFLRQINTASRASKFAINSTLDQKAEFFSYLGMPSFFTVLDGKYLVADNFRETLKKYRHEKPVAAVKSLVEHGYFISSDLDLCQALGVLSAAKNSAAYKMNMQLRRLGYHMRKWPKAIKRDNELDPENQRKTEEVFYKMSSKIIDTFSSTDSTVFVEPVDLRVLLYLASNAGNYITYEELCDNFDTLIFRRALLESLKRLKETQAIQKHPDWRKKEYCITKTGYRSVQQFREMTLKSFNF